ATACNRVCCPSRELPDASRYQFQQEAGLDDDEEDESGDRDEEEEEDEDDADEEEDTDTDELRRQRWVIKLRVIKQLWEGESAEVRQMVKDTVEKRYEAVRQEYETAIADALDDQEDHEWDISTVYGVGQPLLDFFNKRYGLVCTLLLAGEIPSQGRTVEAFSMQSGQLTGVSSARWSEKDAGAHAIALASHVAFAQMIVKEKRRAAVNLNKPSNSPDMRPDERPDTPDVAHAPSPTFDHNTTSDSHPLVSTSQEQQDVNASEAKGSGMGLGGDGQSIGHHATEQVHRDAVAQNGPAPISSLTPMPSVAASIPKDQASMHSAGHNGYGSRRRRPRPRIVRAGSVRQDGPVPMPLSRISAMETSGSIMPNGPAHASSPTAPTPAAPGSGSVSAGGGVSQSDFAPASLPPCTSSPTAPMPTALGSGSVVPGGVLQSDSAPALSPPTLSTPTFSASTTDVACDMIVQNGASPALVPAISSASMDLAASNTMNPRDTDTNFRDGTATASAPSIARPFMALSSSTARGDAILQTSSAPASVPLNAPTSTALATGMAISPDGATLNVLGTALVPATVPMSVTPASSMITPCDAVMHNGLGPASTSTTLVMLSSATGPRNSETVIQNGPAPAFAPSAIVPTSAVLGDGVMRDRPAPVSALSTVPASAAPVSGTAVLGGGVTRGGPAPASAPPASALTPVIGASSATVASPATQPWTPEQLASRLLAAAASEKELAAMSNVDWPNNEWRACYGHCMSRDFGDEYQDTASDFFALAANAEFQGTSNFSSKDRPSVAAAWIKDARKWTDKLGAPKLHNLNTGTIADQWSKWWGPVRSLCPADPTAPSAPQDWKPLFQFSINGLLTPFSVLTIWGNAIGGVQGDVSGTWQAAVHDMHGCLQAMSKFMWYQIHGNSGPTSAKRPLSDKDSAADMHPPSKRRRTAGKGAESQPRKSARHP
ncbi:hypothetical protein EVG20_g9855, partial [Dentipellis fragilis]